MVRACVVLKKLHNRWWDNKICKDEILAPRGARLAHFEVKLTFYLTILACYNLKSVVLHYSNQIRMIWALLNFSKSFSQIESNLRQDHQLFPKPVCSWFDNVWPRRIIYCVHRWIWNFYMIFPTGGRVTGEILSGTSPRKFFDNRRVRNKFIFRAVSANLQQNFKKRPLSPWLQISKLFFS